MEGINARVLTSTAEESVVQVELENGDTVTLFDEQGMLEDAEAGQMIDFESIVVGKEMEVSTKEDIGEKV